jgi:hypothetical protein
MSLAKWTDWVPWPDGVESPLASNFVAFDMDLNLNFKSSIYVPAYLVNVGFATRLSLAG